MTKYTYSQDGFNNKLTELLPGNTQATAYVYADPNNPNSVTKQTDPLGHTTAYTYDAQGHLLSTTDPNGNVATNTYNTQGNLKTGQAAQNQPSSSYLYDANGDLTQQTDPLGLVTAYGYDSSGDQLAVTTAMGKPEQSTALYAYDANGNRLSETKLNPSGSGNQVTTYVYDGSNRVVQTNYPDGTNTKTSYDALGHVVASVDQKGRSTLDFYDAMGRTTSIQYPDTRKSVYLYDNNGNRLSDTEYGTDGTSLETQTLYDPDNRAIKVTYPDESTTSTLYDGQGRVTDSIDENGNDTHNDYNNLRRTDTIAGYNSPVAQETGYQYDPNGNVVETSIGFENTQTQYDSLNRAVTVIYQQPAGQAMVMPSVTQYDADSRKTGQIDQAGNATSYAYDGQARLVSVTDSLGHATSYTYDQLGNELTQTDSNGHVTAYTYDVMNRRTSRTLPGFQVERYTSYDATGNLLAKTTFNGKFISYSYAQSNDLLLNESFSGDSISFSYDGFLRRFTMTDANSGSVTFNYYPRGWVSARKSGNGTLAYIYDAHGNLTNTNSSNTYGTSVEYQYDALNRPTTVTDNHRGQDLVTTYGYDPFGNLQTVTKPNGEAVTYNYDVLNRLNSMAATVTNPNVNGGNPVSVAGYSYTLGPAGNRTSVAELSSRAVTWNYDDLYRLTSETISSDPNVNGGVTYTYDNVGNRQTRASSLAPITTQAFSGAYDANDRLTAGYTYDNDGNTLMDSSGNTYQYDTLDRMTQATVNGVTSTYVYDGDGNKVQEMSNSGTRSFLVDSNNLTGYAQVLEVSQGGSVNIVYTYGSSRISQDRQLTPGTWQLSFYGYDGQGSVRYLTDINGNLANPYEYDAFGNTIWQNTAVPNVMLYDGEEKSLNTGFYNLRARWMNPGIGRFVSMDSYEGDQNDPLSLHKYLFGQDDPTDKDDPSGNQTDLGSLSIEIGVIAVVSSFPTLTFGATNTAGWDKLTNLQIQDAVYRECEDLRSGTDDISLVYNDRAHVIFNGEKYSYKYHVAAPAHQPTYLTAGQQKEVDTAPYDQLYQEVGQEVIQARAEDSNGVDPTKNAIYFNERWDAGVGNLNWGGVLNTYDGFLHTQRAVRGIGTGANAHKLLSKWANTYGRQI